jgi:2-C-methyl-D-erythritol 4-phosphate cytidylyltransferase
MYTLEAFAASSVVARIHVVVAPDDGHFARLDLPEAVRRKLNMLAVGGATRHESVLNGLDALAAKLHDDDWVLVHDAARPGITPSLVARMVEALEADSVGGLLALPLADTLKREADGERGHRVVNTVPREGLWQAQTPQMFRFRMLREALRAAVANGSAVTDEASALETAGHMPRLVLGSARNFKVTYPDDLELAESMLRKDST